jgi:protein-S-isoprenylcysteine O-methyltransferase Ste14
MVLAAMVEERDLIGHFGKQYEQYRQTVPMFIPRLTGKSAANRVLEAETVKV